MRLSAFLLLLVLAGRTGAFVPSKSVSNINNGASAESRRQLEHQPLHASKGGGSLVVDDDVSSPSSSASANTASSRGKVNEIDFCMAPSDVSLSRSYQSYGNAVSSSNSGSTNGSSADASQEQLQQQDASMKQSGRRVLSLTRSLNNASNRAVRRILLSRSWPSAEALNLSLRQVLMANQQQSPNGDVGSESDAEVAAAVAAAADLDVTGTSSSKCPVPRPILNIIMRRKDVTEKDKAVVEESSGRLEDAENGPNGNQGGPTPRSKRGRSDEEWVVEQLGTFRENYGALPGYKYADAYLECILSLATSGVESPRVAEILAAGVYDEAYMRVISVLKSVGVVFEDDPGSNPPRKRIASKLVDKDICLSMMDKLTIAKEKKGIIPSPSESLQKSKASSLEDSANKEPAKATSDEKVENSNIADSKLQQSKKGKKGLRKLMFWAKEVGEVDNKATSTATDASENNANETNGLAGDDDIGEDSADDEEESQITPEDLGAVLLSAKEPTMTRQLNVLSNIVQRALLFGGDQELLVLSETLEADKPAFVQRWYPDAADGGQHEPGVQYFSSLVQVLKDSYEDGVKTELDSPIPLSPSYANAYERLMASCIELGSGYIKPVKKSSLTQPKTAKEELGRFAQWETSMRKTSPDISSYPEDMVGTWQVKDEVGGKTIGVSNVVFKAGGEVVVKPPLEGLRWRLDPGPTHLDTCTFQVLGEDGAILQYRGFVDRGARLEARFSNRSIKVRGAVSFLMRDGDAVLFGEGYSKDILPVNYQAGATRFVMSKVFDVS